VDPFAASLWLLRFLFLAALYLFLFAVVRVLVRDLRASAREPGTEVGRLHVLSSPGGEPPAGAMFALDAVTSLGRDVNNTVVVDDAFASAEHAVLTFRGRAWYLEDRGSTNGTYVNASRIDGLAPIGFGDEIQIGQVRMRLERPRA
jgi:hypothetical protein